MKTDRELLELAAKAAGMNTREFATDSITRWHWRDDGTHTAWNPLTDDGDAMRLAVALCLNVFPSKGWCTVRGGTKKAKSDTRFKIVQHYGWDDDYTQDRAKGTRRAITRAAAAIGERE